MGSFEPVRLPLAPCAAAWEESDRSLAKGVCQLVYIQQGGVPLASLDAADIRSVHIGLFGKVFLGPAARLPRITYTLAECGQDLPFCFGISHSGNKPGG